jgi:hypothetical protein
MTAASRAAHRPSRGARQERQRQEPLAVVLGAGSGIGRGLPVGGVFEEAVQRGVEPGGAVVAQCTLRSGNRGSRARQSPAARCQRLGNYAPTPTALRTERQWVAALLRDIFGPLPFREVRIDSSVLHWNGGAVVQLALAAYERRLMPSGHLDPARLAVLADALEEGGCATQKLLSHLRSPVPHWRGCFAVDAILGRG